SGSSVPDCPCRSVRSVAARGIQCRWDEGDHGGCRESRGSAMKTGKPYTIAVLLREELCGESRRTDRSDVRQQDTHLCRGATPMFESSARVSGNGWIRCIGPFAMSATV